MKDFEARGLSPFEFDYSDSNVLLLKHLEQKRGKDINDVIEKDVKLIIGNARKRQNKQYFE